MSRFMLLPSQDAEKVRLLSIPEDMEEHEAFRCATGVIAQAQEDQPGLDWDDLSDALEEFGFLNVEFILGPEIG